MKNFVKLGTNVMGAQKGSPAAVAAGAIYFQYHFIYADSVVFFFKCSSIMFTTKLFSHSKQQQLVDKKNNFRYILYRISCGF